MKATVGLSVVAVVLLGVDPAEDARKDLDRMQGEWVAASYTVNGQEWAEAKRKALRLTVQGNRSTLAVGDKSGEGTYRLDTGKQPKALDIAITAGTDRGKTKLAIYEFDGDTLRICLDPGGKERPRDFASKAGSGNVLEVWKRAK